MPLFPIPPFGGNGKQGHGQSYPLPPVAPPDVSDQRAVVDGLHGPL